jgi:uncharacterized protein
MNIAPEFSTLAVILAVPLLAALAVDPWFGRRLYQRLEQSRDHDSRALTRFYQRIIGAEWLCAALALATLVLSPGVALADFGLALPATGAGPLPDEPSELAGVAVGLLLAGAMLWFVFRKLAGEPAIAGLWQAGLGTFLAMLPRTSTEGRYAVAVSVTAGICEELIYRGFLIAFGVGVLGLHPYVAGGVAVVLFGVAHLYQGAAGMLRVSVFGVAMTGLYLSTGSLLLPIVVHALGDIVSLVVVPRRLQPRLMEAS